MSKALLEKARAILAHPRQRASQEARLLEVTENNLPTAKAMISTAVEDSSATSPAASAIQSLEVQAAESNAKVAYWEAGDGRILGPAVPEFLGRDGNSFWIVTTFRGQIWWINADRLRSKKSFDAQSFIGGR